MKVLCISAFTMCSFICGAFAGETNYHSPVDGMTYHADWRTYSPTNSGTTNVPAGRVQNQGVQLLSTQEEFRRSLDVSGLADFIRKMEQAIDSSLGDTNTAFELVVQAKLTKDKKPEFELASKGDVSQEALQKIYNAFGQLPDFRSRKAELQYEVRFAIRSETNSVSSLAGSRR